ncbi:MAG: hypothetical protein ABII18_02335 [bacterium]
MSLFNDIKPESFSSIDTLLRPKAKRNLIRQNVATEVKEQEKNKSVLPHNKIENSSLPKTPIDKISTDNKESDVINTSIDIISTHNSEPVSSIDNIGTDLKNTGVIKSSIDDISTHKNNLLNNTKFQQSIINNNLPMGFDNDQQEDKKTTAANSELLDSGLQQSRQAKLNDNQEITQKDIINTPPIDNISTDSKKSIVPNTSIDIISTHKPEPISSIDVSSTFKKDGSEPFLSIDNFSTDVSVDDNNVYTTSFKSNFTKLSNHYFKIWGSLSKIEKIVFLFFYRNSFGWGKSVTNIPLSVRFIETALNISHGSIQTTISSLKAKNLIVEFDTNKLGTTFQINVPADNGLLETPVKDFFTALDNNFFELARYCSVTELLVYLYIYRQSFGFNSNVTGSLILTSKMSAEIGVSLRRTQDAIRGLLTKKLINRISNISSDGISYRVFLPHEIYSCETKTLVNYSKNTTGVPILSIDTFSTPNSSIDNNNNFPIISSIDKNSTPKQFSSKSIDNSTFADNVLNSSIAVSGTKEIKNNLKTSSSDADDFFVFLKTTFPDISFPLAKEKLQTYLSEFGVELCKKHLLRLKPRLLKAESPVGLWIDSLKNPANYPEIEQKTESEFFQEQREKEEEQRRAAQIQEKQKKEKIERINTVWNALDEMQQNEFIAMSEKYFREDMGMGDKLPPRAAIIERAKNINFDKRT